MSGTLTYDARYEEWKEQDTNLIDLQYEIEYEIILRLVNGKTQYQQLIYDHTCKEMFTDKDLRNIYQIVDKYIKTYSITKLNAIDLILALKDKDLKYVQFLNSLKENFICSADAENWIMRLQIRYEKRILNKCKTVQDFQDAQEEINKYKLQTTESKLLDTAMQYLDEYDKKADSLLKTYYPSIDNLIGGLQGGNYMILAGSTGMGKTAMALNLVLNMARHNKKILLFSLEMTTDELLGRIIASEINISSENIRNRNLTPPEMDKYIAYISSYKFTQLQNLITIPATTNLSIAKIEEIARKSKADIVYIDYLGLIKGDTNKTSAYEEISNISRRLKLLAIETNKPFVVLHQLNRDNKSRMDKHPTLSDIRDSGKIEQDADFITFVYRPAYFDPTQDKTNMEFMVAKARHTGGAGKTANLSFVGIYQKITEVKEIV